MRGALKAAQAAGRGASVDMTGRVIVLACCLFWKRQCVGERQFQRGSIVPSFTKLKKTAYVAARFDKLW